MSSSFARLRPESRLWQGYANDVTPAHGRGVSANAQSARKHHDRSH
jgi:hypothetical protein